MSLVLFEKIDSIGKISFNRPDKLNSFNKEMADEFIDALNKCKSDDSIRCVLITGEGRGFSAGQDLSEAIGDAASPISEIVEKQYNPIIKLIREIEKPVLCAVNGVAAGAGANIAFACDITFASSEAVFIQSFSQIGLIPDSGGTYFLPRILGHQRASALAMLGDKIHSKTAKDYGLIFDVFDSEELMEKVMEVAEKLSNMPTRGFALTKKAFNQSLDNSLLEQLELEKKLQAEAGDTYDYNEGVSAFLEKRKPKYKGK